MLTEPKRLLYMYFAQTHLACINNVAMSLYDITSSPGQSLALHINIANAMA